MSILPHEPPPSGWWFLYVLIDPQTNEIRYVGKTQVSLKKRAYKHVEKAKGDRSTCHRVQWLKLLYRRGLRPRIELLQLVPSAYVDDAEKYWIKEMRLRGCDLTNFADGGTGGATRRGMKTPRETVEKQAAKSRGRKHREESKQKISNAHALDRTYRWCCTLCRAEFGGYMARRNHMVRHREELQTRGVHL